MAALALLHGWIAVDGAFEFWRGVAMRGAVEVRTGAGAAIVGAIQLALLTSLLVQRSGEKQRAAFRAVLLLSPLLVVLPLVLWLASEMWLPEQGYARCAPLAGQRFLTSVWMPHGKVCRG